MTIFLLVTPSSNTLRLTSYCYVCHLRIQRIHWFLLCLLHLLRLQRLYREVALIRRSLTIAYSILWCGTAI